jgi:ribosomal-protein-alanine N-acetyltransferase
MSAGMLAYRQLNRQHLQPWEPERGPEFYTHQAGEEQLRAMQRQIGDESAIHWLIHAKDGDEILGACGFTNIVRGPFQACHLGFSLGGEYQGTGYMHEALTAAISHVFEIHKLNRIMANYQPNNQRSERLLLRLGFEREGLAKKYLKINGQWTDHVLTSLINPVEIL